MLAVTDTYKELVDNEIVIVKRDEVIIKDQEGNVIERDSYKAEIDASDVEKGTYDHYMLKEIHEQPGVMRNIIQNYQDEEGTLKSIKKLLKMLHKQIEFISLHVVQVTMLV